MDCPTLHDTDESLDPPDYVYALVDPRDELIRYIGHTRAPQRRYSTHMTDAKPFRRHYDRKAEWIRDLGKAGLRPDLVILATCSQQYVRTVEEALIWHFQDQLLNVRSEIPGLGFLPGRTSTKRGRPRQIRLVAPRFVRRPNGR